MKDQKMLSVRLDSAKFISFKDFCTRNNITMRDVIDKTIDLILQAEKQEQSEKILFPNSITAYSGEQLE